MDPKGHTDRTTGYTGLLLVLVALVSAVGIRLALLDSLTFDAEKYVLRWYEHLATHGLDALRGSVPNALGSGYGNYTPPYYYLLYLASMLDGTVPSLHLVKAVSVAFEVVAAAFAYRIVMFVSGSRGRALLIAAAVVLAPTVVANGSWWGQCDVIWGSLLLGSFSFSLERRHTLSMLLFGSALAFKAQAIFFGPFVLMLFLRRELKVAHILGAGLAFGLWMAPAIALGRDVFDVLSIYLRQGLTYDQLSMNAANLYQFIPNDFYVAVTILGIIATVTVSAVLAVRGGLSIAPLTATTLSLAALMFVALAPFLLPKMHDRYFFAADLFSIAIVGVTPSLWPVAVGFQVSSMLSYVPIISLSVTGEMVTTPMPAAGLLNLVLVCFLVVRFWRTLPVGPMTVRSVIEDLAEIARKQLSPARLPASLRRRYPEG